MAKNQSRKPGRDVRGGTGKRQEKIAPMRGGTSRMERTQAKRTQASSARRGQRLDEARDKRPQRKMSGQKADLVIGRRAAAEALAAGVPVKSALVQNIAGERDATLEALVKQLEGEGIEVERVPKGKLDALAEGGAHQGVVLRARPFEYAELADVIAAAGEGDALVVVLDHVTDQGNLGAIIRTAEVVGAAGVVIPSVRAAGVGVGAYKTSAGAVMHLPIARVPNLARALEDLKDAGFWAAAATEHAADDVWHAPFGGRLALVMGSEGEGISRLVREKCDFECRLPQRGVIESLNVAQATTVLCYEWLRRVSLAEEAGE
ncbi:MAG: 23S rRNA (guanosine(2251)-2'-O)-methyltransferase RlmB [Coriobacteriales bacterium]|nr:23S rRNA (guanosine(2251)-2'-O)-methyltransferase RlmB [Coriobacteriales bacterium]